jgi:hypothetical protein
MSTGGQTPEELETLLEDAILLGDADTIACLFEPGSLFILDEATRELRGRGEIRQAGPALRLDRRGYLAAPRRVFQARDTALLLGPGVVNVVRRSKDGTWRYAVCFLFADEGETQTTSTPG